MFAYHFEEVSMHNDNRVRSLRTGRGLYFTYAPAAPAVRRAGAGRGRYGGNPALACR